MRNFFKQGLGTALLAVSVNTASAEGASAPSTLIGPDAMKAFFTCATQAISDVLDMPVTLENPEINIVSELGHHSMRVSAGHIPTEDKGKTISLSVEWTLDKDSAPVNAFDAKGALKTIYAIIEQPSDDRFGSAEHIVTAAQALAAGQRIDIKVGGNANRSSMLRDEVLSSAEQLIIHVRACAPSV